MTAVKHTQTTIFYCIPDSKSSLPGFFPFSYFMYIIFLTFSGTQEEEGAYGHALEVKIHRLGAWLPWSSPEVKEKGQEQLSVKQDCLSYFI